jgi:hypothetical protein
LQLLGNRFYIILQGAGGITIRPKTEFLISCIANIIKNRITFSDDACFMICSIHCFSLFSFKKLA